jgi:aryl-alcohol dehydrogenase (NADP+)
MRHRRLGQTGLKVSEICLGTMTFGGQSDEASARAILDRAAHAGVDFIDTADCYPVPLEPATCGRTEEIVGRWLRGRRARFVLATKAFFPTGPGANERGNSRRHLIAACEASLRRLDCEWIDLYQVHAFDAETPLDETLRALDDLVRAGKVRYAGCSNFRAWELSRALARSERRNLVRFDSTQPRYNLLHREIETELLPLCRAEGVGVIVFNPLAGGLLTGKHAPGQEPAEDSRFGTRLGSTAVSYRRRYWQAEALASIAALKSFFEARGQSLTSAAMAFVLEQPGISAAIVGASRVEQLGDSLAGADLQLDDEARTRIDQVWYDLPRRRPEPGPVR